MTGSLVSQTCRKGRLDSTDKLRTSVAPTVSPMIMLRHPIPRSDKIIQPLLGYPIESIFA